MRRFLRFVLAVAVVSCLGGCSRPAATPPEKTAAIQIVDDSGRTVRLNAPARRIVSLYSAHTENLFSLGVGDRVIGVGKSDTYPPEVRGRPSFDYRSDPEKMIALSPDLVVIRPYVAQSAPEFVSALEKAGITVVSLYPETFEKFGPYIERLATLVGAEESARRMLQEFSRELAEMRSAVEGIQPRVRAFFESSEQDCRTVARDAIPARAIEVAGGINIAADAEAVRGGTSIAAYGAERLLARAGEIDVYVAQVGVMNSGVTPRSIAGRPGFGAIKAVGDGRVYVIDEKLVSSPTFRFVKGVRELARMFYPQVFDDVSGFRSSPTITREELARISLMFKHKPVFTPGPGYYRTQHRGHVYGSFADVPVTHPSFDYIETAVLSGYMEAQGDLFNPQALVTRDELARTLYMLLDLEHPRVRPVIQDIGECNNPSIVEAVVGNILLGLKGRKFMPRDPVSGVEVVEALAAAARHQR